MRKSIVVCMLIAMLASLAPQPHGKTAAASSGSAPKQETRALIVYSLAQKEDIHQVRILDMLAGHFSRNSTVISDEEIASVSGEAYTHLFYYGLQQKELPGELIRFVEEFKGPAMLINENVRQFPGRYGFVTRNNSVLTSAVTTTSSGELTVLPEERLATEVQVGPDAEILMSGTTAQGEVPLLARKGSSYYLASASLFNPMGYLLGETLFSFFGQEGSRQPTLYLRLEDIHPKSEHKKVMEIAKYLKSKNIPYMLSVIPVYTNPETQKEIHLEDSPKLVKALRYAQDNGGSIVLHGYRHQYRSSETGEGFEYWDAEYDHPITQPASEQSYSRDHFDTEEAYEAYLKEGQAFEERYVKETLEKGVQELIDLKLYPLAFEAPHYAMSSTGYATVASHFSTYVGQLQLSDLTWTSNYAPLYESYPSYLKGMRLLPETIGYVENGDQNGVAAMMKKASIYEHYTDSYIAGFYHPYLGFDLLESLIGEMQMIKNAKWLDLKNMDNEVSVSNISIRSSGGLIQVEVDGQLIAEDEDTNYVQQGFPYAAILVAVLITVFIIRRRRAAQA
ncbi:hypothetical protein DNH61_08875 [Paenibacillus sambharensis]|uniref:DUF2334 domain-containing protein n=1 Tax=Paenibacillus sambharensis TaxID=1803190 RepID=A0A2W1LXR0_9BACL|nr:DUF2334 domain-containing protein [Paenibacillus sambharensis]PZD96297.1 hypothetical protein DNH61_08875 [Paenibacillus sambharensis]